MKKLILFIILMSIPILAQEKPRSSKSLIMFADLYGNLLDNSGRAFLDSENKDMYVFGSKIKLTQTGAQVQVILNRVDSVSVALAFLNVVQDSFDVKLNRGEATTLLVGKQDTVLGISNTEIGYLDGLTDTVQQQLDLKGTIVVDDSLASDIADNTTAISLKASIIDPTFTNNIIVNDSTIHNGRVIIAGANNKLQLGDNNTLTMWGTNGSTNYINSGDNLTIQTNYSKIIDIDNDNNSDSEVFSIRKDGTTNLLRVEETGASIFGTPSDTVTGGGTINAVAVYDDGVLLPDRTTWDWGVMDSIVVGDLVGYKVPYDITITKVSTYCDVGTVTFNIEERAAATPNTTGTDVFAAEFIAPTTGLDSTSFTNADLDEGDWINIDISARGGGVLNRFGVTVAYKRR